MYSKLAYLLFIWAPKRLSKSGWNGKTMSKGLKTRRELAAEMKLHSTRHVMDARANISIFEMKFPISSLQLVHSWRPLSFFLGPRR